MCVTDPWAHMSFMHSILSLKLGVSKYECINIENFGNLVFPFNIENFRYWDESFGLEVYARNNVVTTGIQSTDGSPL